MATKQTKLSSKSKRSTKQDRIITLLKRSKGATLAELAKVSDWQEHSIRGFMSGTLKKRLKLDVESEKTASGIRRYRIVANETEPAAKPSNTKIEVDISAEQVAG